MTSAAVPARALRARLKALLRLLFGAPTSQHGPWMLAVGLILLVTAARYWDNGRPLWVHVADFVGVALCVEGVRALRNNGGGAA